MSPRCGWPVDRYPYCTLIAAFCNYGFTTKPQMIQRKALPLCAFVVNLYNEPSPGLLTLFPIHKRIPLAFFTTKAYRPYA
jgi:hypothetical protein